MFSTSPVRRFLVRRPWVYWLVVLVLAAVVGISVQDRLAAVDDARDSWAQTQPVWVADRDHAAGDPMTVREAELPAIAIPATAVDRVRPGAVARQAIAAGETIVDGDLIVGIGPAALAADGQVVVPVGDPLVPDAPIGVAVSIYADGVVLAASAKIVSVQADVIYVAVDEDDGPIVAAAAQQHTASIVFIR